MRQAFVPAFALLVLIACKSPATKAGKARDELASWAATGEMLSREWSRGRAQTPYVKSTVRVASDEVERLRRDIGNEHAPGEVSELYRKFSNALEQKDRSSAAQLARPFGAISRRLQKPS